MFYMPLRYVRYASILQCRLNKKDLRPVSNDNNDDPDDNGKNACRCRKATYKLSKRKDAVADNNNGEEQDRGNNNGAGKDADEEIEEDEEDRGDGDAEYATSMLCGCDFFPFLAF